MSRPLPTEPSSDSTSLNRTSSTLSRSIPSLKFNEPSTTPLRSGEDSIYSESRPVLLENARGVNGLSDNLLSSSSYSHPVKASNEVISGGGSRHLPPGAGYAAPVLCLEDEGRAYGTGGNAFMGGLKREEQEQDEAEVLLSQQQQQQQQSRSLTRSISASPSPPTTPPRRPSLPIPPPSTRAALPIPPTVISPPSPNESVDLPQFASTSLPLRTPSISSSLHPRAAIPLPNPPASLPPVISTFIPSSLFSSSSNSDTSAKESTLHTPPKLRSSYSSPVLPTSGSSSSFTSFAPLVKPLQSPFESTIPLPHEPSISNPPLKSSASFSSQDRAVYLTHIRQTSQSQSQSVRQPSLRDRPSSSPLDYYDAGFSMGRGIGMEGPYPSLSPSANKGKGRQMSTGGAADAEADLTRRTSNKYYSGSVAGARDDPNGTIGQGDRISLVGGLIRGPSVDLGEGMVGVGRNSIIRNSMIGGVGSPKSGTLLLGPAPNGIPVDRSDRERERDKRPPHLVPQPEICVECMMRDRDMIDVDVTGDGVWERESDAEWEEALRLDSMRDDTGSQGDRGSEEGFANTDPNGRKRRMSSNAGGGEGSRESAGGRSYASGRKKIGRGQPLTVASLKLWTSMHPPAAAFRWKTLQLFLNTQLRLIELQRQARESSPTERDRIARPEVRQPTPGSSSIFGVLGASRSRSTTALLPDSQTVETINVDKRSKGKTSGRANEDRRGSGASSFGPSPTNQRDSPAPSVKEYAHGDQPWLSSQGRRFSSPALKGFPLKSPSSASIRTFSFGKFTKSSTDLRSMRSPSPGRASLGVDDRRGSLWSKFRSSASQSVLSFAPSGSMMDMHLGLSMDKHMAYTPYDTYPSASDPAFQRSNEGADRYRSPDSEQETTKRKKKGIKGFFSKLISSSDTKKQPFRSNAYPESPGISNRLDEDDLPPPPPIPALINEPRYHQRSLSNSSIDSYQQRSRSPTSLKHPRAASAPLMNHPPLGTSPPQWSPDYLAQSGPADRTSVYTMGSFGSTLFKQSSPAARNDALRSSVDYPDPNSPITPQMNTNNYGTSSYPRSYSPEYINELNRSTGSTGASLRKEKSLPSIPPVDPYLNRGPGPPLPTAYATYPYPSSNQNDFQYMHGNGAIPRDNRSVYEARTPSLTAPNSARSLGNGSPWNGVYASHVDELDEVGGGNKSKARNKVWSMNFGGFNKKKSESRTDLNTSGRSSGFGRNDDGEQERLAFEAREGVRRSDGVVGVRY